MAELIASPKKLQELATALAASIPPYLDKPTIPPLDWHQEGDRVTVILADGRKVGAKIQEINELMFSQGVASSPKPLRAGPEVQSQPVPEKPKGGSKKK
jgi:hypothetical protein